MLQSKILRILTNLYNILLIIIVLANIDKLKYYIIKNIYKLEKDNSLILDNKYYRLGVKLVNKKKNNIQVLNYKLDIYSLVYIIIINLIIQREQKDIAQTLSREIV